MFSRIPQMLLRSIFRMTPHPAVKQATQRQMRESRERTSETIDRTTEDFQEASGTVGELQKRIKRICDVQQARCSSGGA